MGERASASEANSLSRGADAHNETTNDGDAARPGPDARLVPEASSAAKMGARESVVRGAGRWRPVTAHRSAREHGDNKWRARFYRADTASENTDALPASGDVGPHARVCLNIARAQYFRSLRFGAVHFSRGSK